jgi:hypothetical protein
MGLVHSNNYGFKSSLVWSSKAFIHSEKRLIFCLVFLPPPPPPTPRQNVFPCLADISALLHQVLFQINMERFFSFQCDGNEHTYEYRGDTFADLLFSLPWTVQIHFIYRFEPASPLAFGSVVGLVCFVCPSPSYLVFLKCGLLFSP